MADADLDVIIRQLAKQQTRTLTAAAKKRRGHFEALAAKAKDAAGKARYKDIAKEAQAQGLGGGEAAAGLGRQRRRQLRPRHAQGG